MTYLHKPTSSKNYEQLEIVKIHAHQMQFKKKKTDICSLQVQLEWRQFKQIQFINVHES